MFSQTLCCVTTIVAIIGIADIFHRQLEEKEAMRKQMAELQKEKEEAEKSSICAPSFARRAPHDTRTGHRDHDHACRVRRDGLLVTREKHISYNETP